MLPPAFRGVALEREVEQPDRCVEDIPDRLHTEALGHDIREKHSAWPQHARHLCDDDINILEVFQQTETGKDIEALLLEWKIVDIAEHEFAREAFPLESLLSERQC